MRSSKSSLVTVSLLALSIAACGNSGGSDDPADAQPPARTDPGGTGAGADGRPPAAEPVGNPATNEDLTEELGLFVAPNGADNADGTRAYPLARIQSAIDLAKTLGKRV